MNRLFLWEKRSAQFSVEVKGRSEVKCIKVPRLGMNDDKFGFFMVFRCLCLISIGVGWKWRTVADGGDPSGLVLLLSSSDRSPLSEQRSMSSSDDWASKWRSFRSCLWLLMSLDCRWQSLACTIALPLRVEMDLSAFTEWYGANRRYCSVTNSFTPELGALWEWTARLLILGVLEDEMNFLVRINGLVPSLGRPGHLESEFSARAWNTSRCPMICHCQIEIAEIQCSIELLLSKVCTNSSFENLWVWFKLVGDFHTSPTFFWFHGLLFHPARQICLRATASHWPYLSASPFFYFTLWIP